MPFQKDDANDWTKFRQKAVSKQFCAETILKENALFLLDLRPCEDASRLPIRLTPKKVANTYKINLYPQGSAIPQKEPSTDDALLVDTDLVNNISLSPLHHVSHQSDPGKQQNDLSAIGEGDPFSLSASANLFRRPQVPSSLPPLPQRLTSLNGIHELLRHPVLLFCVETHNLQSLRRYFYHSISRGTKFAYAFRVWNWLLKLVTSETIVTDIVWNYLTTLGSYSSYNHWLNMDLKFATKLKLLPHPWRLCYLAGTDVSGAMIDEMHSFLGTLAVILQSPGVDMSLKCLCFKAWTFHLTLHEQNLLITMCNILSAVGAVLSDTSSDMSSLFDESALSILAGFGPSTLASTTTFQQKKLSPKKPIRQLSSSHINAINQVSIKQHENLSNILKIGPSSRPQLTHCLIDGSLETFWESGDEDKNRARRLNISWDNEIYRLELLGIFIDNIRDTNFKVTQITIRNSKIIIYNASVDWVRIYKSVGFHISININIFRHLLVG
uniref:DOC domain-containing protein n=1 Tax=Panagrolaimus davidi TaxID=227884 RepID=A0A914QDX2_9BILA